MPIEPEVTMSLVSEGLGVGGRLRNRPILLAIIVVLLALIAAGVILVASSGSASQKPDAPSSGAPSASASTGTTVQAVSVATLKALPASLGHPVYWAGPLSGATYELTRTPDGRAYVRYLTGGAKVGSPLPDFLTVGTYVLPNAEAAVRAASAQPGAVSVPLAGGVAFYNRARPTSVYFAFPGSNVQVETYDPSAAVARRLVQTGAIKPVS
jgi:hypothetical protein